MQEGHGFFRAGSSLNDAVSAALTQHRQILTFRSYPRMVQRFLDLEPAGTTVTSSVVINSDALTDDGQLTASTFQCSITLASGRTVSRRAPSRVAAIREAIEAADEELKQN